MLRVAPLVAHERRVAQHIAALLGRQHFGPVGAQGVGVVDVRAIDQGHGRPSGAEALGGFQVHLVVGDPQRHAGDVRGGLVNLDAIELAHAQARQGGYVEQAARLPALAEQQFNDFVFQAAQFAVGDDQKVAAAAGGIEKGQRGELVVQGLQPGFAVAGGGEFVAQVVHAQGAEYAQDVAFAGVVRAEFAAAGLAALVRGMRFEHALEHGAENGRGNARPVEVDAAHEHGAQFGVEGGDAGALGKQAAVDIGEGAQVVVERGLALVFGGVEHVEQFGERGPQVFAVGAGTLHQAAEHTVVAKDAGVVGEQAEQQPGEEDFEVAAFEADVEQAFVQLADGVGGIAVDGRFFDDLRGFVFEQKAEPVGLARQSFERGFPVLAFAQVVQADAGEVGGDDVARALGLGQGDEVIGGLIEGFVEIFAPAFVFDDEFAGDEAVDEAARAAELVHGLFVDGGRLGANAKTLVEA